MAEEDDAGDFRGGPESSSLTKGSRDSVLPEIVEALRQEGSHVDVNVLLVQIVNRTKDPDAIVENAKKMLAIAREYEEARVENFKRMADAIIEVKDRDPDELEKRRNNRMRRSLKGVVGFCSIAGLGGGIAATLLGGNIVAVGALLTAGAIALAMAGPLAVGESMSPSDVVRIVREMGRMLPGRRSDEDDDEEKPSEGQTPRKKRHRQ